jgi:hypothetical protein
MWNWEWGMGGFCRAKSDCIKLSVSFCYSIHYPLPTTHYPLTTRYAQLAISNEKSRRDNE